MTVWDKFCYLMTLLCVWHFVLLLSGCKDPSLQKENKASSGAKDNAKSVEVGTRKVGHQRNLSGGQSSMRAGKLWKTKCDIVLRLV